MSDNSDMDSLLKKRVAARMEALGINAFEAARAGELERNFVNDILNGKKDSVRGANLTKLAKALQCPVNYLVNQDAPAPDEEPEDVGPPSHFARAWREYRNLTTAQLAHAMNIYDETIKGVEAGDLPLGGKRLDDMAKALKTTPGRILTVDPSDIDPEALDAFGRMAPENKPAALAMLRALGGNDKK